MLILAMMVVGAVVGLLCLIAIPIVLVGVIMGVIFYALAQLIFLPVRLVGWSLAMGAGVLLLMVKIVAFVFLGFIATLLILALAIPLMPMALIGLGIFLAFRARRRHLEATARTI